MTSERRDLVSALASQVAERPNAIAFHFEGRDTRFGEFDRRTNRIANALIAAGLPLGAHVAFVGKNSDTFFEILFGAFRAGMIATPLNHRLAPPEMAYILKDADASIIFCDEDCHADASQALAQLPSLGLRILVDGDAPGWSAYSKWRDVQPDTAPSRAIGPDSIALQLYTSGTTGHPKGVMLAHRNLLNLVGSSTDEAEWNRWQPDHVALISMPLFHIAGIALGYHALVNGAKTVILREFEPVAVLDAIQRHRVTKTILVPAALRLVVQHPKARDADYRSLDHILYGASAMPLNLLKEAIALFDCGFIQMYGLTETTGGLTVLAPEDHVSEGSPRMLSAGKAFRDTELAIVDPQRKALPIGETGEIAIRSGSNMVGYWRKEAETAAAIDADGWFYSGDAGYLDADGYLYIQDRIKDMIISGGENVYPAEVESAIFAHPAVADVAVIGVPDDKWGESVLAIVVLKPGTSATDADIIAFSRQRIAAYKSPKAVLFVDELPRNASGKVLRRELREPFWRGRDRQIN